VEHRADAAESNPYSGTASFTEFRPTSVQQAFDIRPWNVGRNGIREDDLQSSAMFCAKQ